MSIFDFFYIYHAFFLIKKCTVLTYKNKQFHRSFCETFNQIEKKLTIILPNMEDPRMKIKSKTLTSMDILKHRAFFHKTLYASRKISFEIKRFLDASRDAQHMSRTTVNKWKQMFNTTWILHL